MTSRSLRRAIERADRKRPSTSVNLVALQEALAAIDAAADGRRRADATSFRWPELERLASDMLDMSRVIAEEGAHPTSLRCGDERQRAA